MVLGTTLIACDSMTTPKKIARLNGYWEIKEAKPMHGKPKAYKFNRIVDYFKLKKDSTGYRKKLKPTIDGKYKIIDGHENFKLKMENDSLRFYYSTKLSHWKETLISLEKNSFKVRNKEGIIYTYKRFTGYLDHGKKK